MDIDMGALRALEREREISMEVLLEAIESALLAAYQHTPHPAREARVEMSMARLKSGMTRPRALAALLLRSRVR